MLPPWKSKHAGTDKKGNSAAYLIWPQDGTNDSGFIVINGLEVNAPDVVGVERIDQPFPKKLGQRTIPLGSLLAKSLNS